MITVRQLQDAICKLYSQVAVIRGDVAYDINGNEVVYDLEAVTAQAEADAQAIIDAKQSAISKLTALGLSEDEVKAILGASA